MQTSKMVALAVLASIAVATTASGCAATPSEDATSGSAAISGSVQDAKLERIKAVYEAASAKDFKPLPDGAFDVSNLTTAAALRDEHWFTLRVDGTNVVVLDAVGNANAIFGVAASDAGYDGDGSDGGASASTPEEPLVFIYEQSESIGADGASKYYVKMVLLFRPNTGTWSGAQRDLPSSAVSGQN